ncbi:MAG: aminotransferase class IV [Planctomycetota bacterium]
MTSDDEPSPDALVRVAFHNDRWVPAESMTMRLEDLALTQAVCAVERIRGYDGRLFRCDAHLDRWSNTLRVLRMEHCPRGAAMKAILDRLLVANRPWIERTGDFGALVIASPGIGMGQPTLIADLYSIDQILIRHRIGEGTPLVVTSVQQPPNESWPRAAKVRCRLHYYLADSQARATQTDALGVLLDQDGTITETSIANLLLVEGTTIFSPESDQILPGVSLGVLRELAAANGMGWSEQRLTPERLAAADEVLLTGTSCGVWFANSIDGASKKRGPIYATLRSAFERFVRQQNTVR